MSVIKSKYNSIIFIFLFTVTISAQNNPKISEADELLQKNKIEDAEKLYKEVLAEEPSNNSVIMKLAGLYHSNKNYEEAIKYYSQLTPGGNPFVLYNLACSFSMNGNKEEALNSIQQSVDKGFSQIGLLKTDTDLENIRNEEKFSKILKSVKVLENFPEANKFDFWVGDWNVYNTQEQKVGESKIEKILKDAVILENWFGGTGYVGKSFNHFNMDKNKWIQYWADQNSTGTYFAGNFDESQNALVYYSYDHAKDKNPYIRRLTFFNLGQNKVRQFSQRSNDNELTWFTEYDFLYIRKQ